MRRLSGARPTTVALVCLLAAAAGGRAAPPVRVVAAGDLACDPADPAYQGGAGTATACRMAATSELALALAPHAVLLLGDNQYDNGSLAKYQASFDPSWGRLRAITRPSAGNHDYGTPGAAGYFAYFGAAAGDPRQGWHAFGLPGWRLIALNSNCAAIGGCGPGSPQERWLAEELAAHPGVCTLAYWHHPRFSSGPHGPSAAVATLWERLWAAGADLVLAGHDHLYERFAPQDPLGNADPAGVRQLVVGTGGRSLYAAGPAQPNSEAIVDDAFGVLELTLHPDGYLWRFVPVEGGPGDAGGALCHAAWPSGATLTALPRCRVVATRRPPGPDGGPALAAAGARDFPVAGHCGVPADAVAVLVEVKALAATRRGWLTLRPAGGAPPAQSTLDFWKGRPFATTAIVLLGADGQVSVDSVVTGSGRGKVHLILDVTGYFR